MRDYCERQQLDFKHLAKEQRIPRVQELAVFLMDALRHVMPILPVPVIAAVMVRRQLDAQEDLKLFTSLDIVRECDELIDTMIERGAAMKPAEKPRHRTWSNSLDLLVERNLLLEENDCYSVNSQHQALIEYYANSIEHWWRLQEPSEITKLTGSKS